MGNFIESVMHARLIHHSSFRSSEVGMVHTATKSILVLCAGGEKGKKIFLRSTLHNGRDLTLISNVVVVGVV